MHYRFRYPVAFVLYFSATLLLTMLTGCQENNYTRLNLPEPLLPQEVKTTSVKVTVEGENQELDLIKPETTRIIATPTPLEFAAPDEYTAKSAPFPYPSTERVDVNFHEIPLPSFINEVYGNVLGVSFEVEPKLNKTRDLVTLRTGVEQTPAQLDRLARQVLSNYGVTVERQGDLLRFSTSTKATSGIPLLISGRALPEVPNTHRPIFQLVPLAVVRNTNVRGWLKQAFQGQDLEIFEDPERNAVLVKGSAVVVEQALVAIKFLDQPYMRGRHSVRIEPLFLNAKELSKLLVDVLKTEGYSASLTPPMGSIIVLPVENLNAILVFAASAEILNHVKQWALNLDKPGGQAGKKGIFFYDVQNTTAADIGKVVNELLSGQQSSRSSSTSRTKNNKTPTVRRTLQRNTGQKLVVDELRNSLIFQGEPSEWQEILSLLRHFDKPAKQVLIEVTIAEITLTEETEQGIEWLFNLSISDYAGQAATLGGLGLSDRGFSFNLESGGETRAMLNAFASEDLVNIVSTPRIMVKSGTSASIDVGTDVPTVTSQQASSELSDGGDTGILQTIEYRKTGVLLSVKPTVYSGNRVDLEVTQEMSEVSSKTATDIKSPSILTRRIETSLTLRDGGSVLLGGLIYTTSSDGTSGVPLLKDIPYLGQLFRVDTVSETRTMLVMLIVPYTVENDQDAREITEAMKAIMPTMQKTPRTMIGLPQ